MAENNYVLRDYQQAALDGIRDKLSTHDSTLLVCATGLGKTIIFCHYAKQIVEAAGRVMMLAHREELVGQAWRHFKDITGQEPDTEMGEFRANTYGAWQSKIVVGTVQTQIAGMKGKGRMSRFDPDEFGLLIIDEAHHSAAKTYRRIIDYYRQNPKLKVIGATATPDRNDEKALGQIFESVAFEYDILDGIENGWLVDIEQSSVYVHDLDYSDIRTTAGDLNGADLARVVEQEKILHEFVGPIVDRLGGKKTLVFAASVAHAERLTEILNRHKPKSARWVYAGTPKDERRALWPAYDKGEFQYLVNVGITTEGWDCPSVEAVALCRPTKSRSLYAQMIGRGTRTLPAIVDDCHGADARRLAILSSQKPKLEVLDFVGNAGRHKLITPADILGGRYDDEIVERAKKKAAEKSGKSGEAVGVMNELDAAQRQIAIEKAKAEEAARRAKIKLRAQYSTAKVSPFDVYDIQPWRERAWHKDREPTPKQIAFLERQGVDLSGLSFTHAGQLINRIIADRKSGKATYRQTKVLQRFGYDTGDMQFEKAGELIDQLKKNGWKRNKEAV